MEIALAAHDDLRRGVRVSCPALAAAWRYGRFLLSKRNLSHTARPITTSAEAKTTINVVVSSAIGRSSSRPHYAPIQALRLGRGRTN